MTQYHASKGLKVFGKEGTDAVLSELKQLHDQMVMDPKNPETMTNEGRKESLQYPMFLTKKRSGQIKGRGCADGCKQQTYEPKDDTSAPTVATEALMLSCLIDVMEGRYMATVDIPGASMEADMDGIFHMKIEGTIAELLTKLDPKHYRYST
eukprot:7848157-Ditylum_brightwellii.AAC.1